ncbi:MAG: hypothetical protein JOY85_09040, partial [Acidobacteriaceae bacterium]|nr:hypothetical protein [Acidobacteriaceae bacterium]
MIKNVAWFGMALVLATGLVRLAAQGPGGGRAAQALFAALDTDGDGTLTHREIEAGFGAWFQNWNTAHNGTLTREEITAGLGRM